MVVAIFISLAEFTRLPTATDRTAARRLHLRRLLVRRSITDQAELVRLLADRSHAVTQTTVSRDLRALGARKDPDSGRYVLAPTATGAPTATLAERLRQFALEIAASANLVVINTPPGTAHSVGVALDANRRDIPEILGCVAGDDTLLVVSRSPRGGTALARRLRRFIEP